MLHKTNLVAKRSSPGLLVLFKKNAMLILIYIYYKLINQKKKRKLF
jgi:hypothetical protein